MTVRYASTITTQANGSYASEQKNPLRKLIDAQGVVIGDGGFGTALGDESQQHVLWGAQHLFRKDGHQLIQSVHKSFLEAGADILGTASYQASYEMFRNANAFSSLPGGAILKERSQLRFTSDVLRASVELAKQSRYLFWKEEKNRQPNRQPPLVAASVGPVGDNVALWTGATDQNTAVHDVPDAAVSEYYSRKIESLALGRPDLISLETLPSVREATLALAALRAMAPTLPALVSFICTSDEATAAGDDFAEAVAAAVQASPQVVGVGLNCTSPQHVAPLLRRARERAPEGTILMAAPNSGEAWDSSQKRRCWQGDMPVLDGSHALEMRDAGAHVVGGCCRVTAAQIRTFREALLPPAAVLDDGGGAGWWSRIRSVARG